MSRTVWHPRKGSGFYIHLKERILKPFCSMNGKGYLGVKFLDKENHKKELIPLHILVYSTFVGEIPDHMTINHKDGNKFNNKLSNLELATYSENIDHAYHVLKRSTKETFYNYYAEDIVKNNILHFNSATEEGKYFDVTPQTINCYCNGTFKGIFLNQYILSREEKSNVKAE